jgi:hypothetical protein
MEYFERLGERVEDAWRAKNYNEEAFPEIAEKVLRDEPAHRHVTPGQVIDWIQRTRSLPIQADPRSVFGQPPVTLYAGRGFIIDIYFWLDGSTSIHQHAFSGAFQVLAGGSVHGMYRFDPQESVNSHLRLGDVQLQDIELLKVGDCRRIYGGARFIHALFHLDRPSVTIVIRTQSELSWSPQYDYLPPHVAIDSFYEEPLLRKKIEFADLLRQTDPARHMEFLSQLLAGSDAHTAFVLLRHFSTQFPEAERLASLVREARTRHGEWFRHLDTVFAEANRKTYLIEMRRRIHDPNHRFLLALFLNVPERDATLRLIVEQNPGADGLTTLMKWLGELAQLPSPVDPTEPNALGVPFEEDTLLVLRCAIQGLSLPATIEAMAAEGYDKDELTARRSELESFREGFRRSNMFKTLLDLKTTAKE